MRAVLRASSEERLHAGQGDAVAWPMCVCHAERCACVQQCPGADEMDARIVLEEMRQMWRYPVAISAVHPRTDDVLTVV